MMSNAWRTKVKSVACALLAGIFGLLISASSSRAATLGDGATTEAAISASPSSADEAYKLGAGDKVQITVYGEEDLSGPFEVDGSGKVRLPLIGEVDAGGLTLNQFEAVVEGHLAGRFLLSPRVSVSVINYRPFAILGEVQKPGEYPYENGMTVLNAVAIGGGYTYRADQRFVYIRRKGAVEEQKLPADDQTRLFPGDTVRVDERIF